MRLVSGIHQIQLPHPDGIDNSTNSYIIEGENGNILVDCGLDWPDAISAFRDGMIQDSLKIDDIKWIILTHIHPDHYGLAAKLRDLCNAKIVMHKTEADLLNTRYNSYQSLLNTVDVLLGSSGVPQSEIAAMREAAVRVRKFVTYCIPDVVINDDDKVTNGSFEFDVLRTPGHSPGHICLYEPSKRWLISGDQILFNRMPGVGKHPQSTENPLNDYLNDVQKISEYKIRFVFPGHGPVFNSVKLRTAEIIGYHELKKRNIIKILNEGLKTAFQIASSISWESDNKSMSYSELSTRERRSAIFKTLAYLHLLTTDRKIGRIKQNNVFMYLPVV